jgi:hypothetical protein
MENNVCKNKVMALSILEALSMNTDSAAQRAALQAVMEYVEKNCHDIPEDPAERKKLMEEIERELALTGPDYRKLVRLHCDLLPDDEPDFGVIILPPGSDSMLRKEGGDDEK